MHHPSQNLSIVLLLLASLNFGFSQERVYYIDWCENFKDETLYDIKRVVRNHPEKKFQYITTDYYRNGQLLTTGITKSKNGKVRDGEYTFYHPNGTKMASGNIEKDLKKGAWSYWDSNGLKITKPLLVNKFSHVNFSEDSITYEGYCFCYLKEASWVKKNTLSSKVTTYEFSEGNQIALNGVFSSPDDSATYKTGIEDFYKYLVKELKYPFISRLKGKHGKVFVQFTIDKDGNILNPNFLVTLDKQTEKKIIEVLVSTSGRWNPAIYKGAKVSSTLVLPVVFELH